MDGRFIHSSRFNGPIDLSRGKFLVNVGSVGQPRDQNPQSCYVVVDGPTIQFRRIPYDYRTTGHKIRKIRELSDQLATRLALGV
jgi:diadenosine tetraphosphatase ApaH/serine/threonine PP2A family protein phosphatase